MPGSGGVAGRARVAARSGWRRRTGQRGRQRRDAGREVRRLAGSGPSGTVRAPGGAGGSGTGAPGMSGGIWPGMAAAGTPGVKPGPFGFGVDVATSGGP